MFASVEANIYFTNTQQLDLIVFFHYAYIDFANRTTPAKGSKMKIIHYDQRDLANRWRLSPRTLERWRWEGIGPHYLKIGGRVIYRLSDVEEYETARVRECVPYDAEAKLMFMNTQT